MDLSSDKSTSRALAQIVWTNPELSRSLDFYTESIKTLRGEPGKYKLGDVHHADHWWSSAGNHAAELSSACFSTSDWDGCIDWERKSGEAFVDFFFGDWQDTTPLWDGPPDRKRWFKVGRHSYCYWTSYFDRDVPWLAVAHRWDLLGRVLEFPTPEVRPDEDGESPRKYYIGLGRWWRDRQDFGGLDEAASVRGAGSKLYHLLGDMARAISARDSDALKKLTPKTIDQYLKSRDHEGVLPMSIALVWNVARKDGLSIDFPPDVSKWLFEIPASYWATHQEPDPPQEPASPQEPGV